MVTEEPKEKWFEMAIEHNRINKTLRKDDLFDWLFRIKTLKAEGLTQAQIGARIGWEENHVKKHSMLLNKIVPQVLELAERCQDGRETDDVPNGTFNFTEGLLRNILPLQPQHQEELVEDLIAGNINKSRFARPGQGAPEHQFQK